MSRKKKVLVAMSGGVDSSVAAFLLKELGFEVIGVTMKIWAGEGPSGEGVRHACYGPGEEEDIKDAMTVAEKLDIPFHVFDLRKDYRASVLDYARDEYLSGRTPNPCIRCNRLIKLGALLESVRDSGLDYDNVATGHYVRVRYDEVTKRHLLMKARDVTKDQSYILYSLSQEQLGICLFPLGEYSKREVRKKARDAGLGISDKIESQDFMAGGHSRLFDTTVQPGPILDHRGRTLGEHKGIPFYTIGQRRGLGISAGKPLYVIDIDPSKNTVRVGTRESLFRSECTATQLNWISEARLERPLSIKARIRYTHKEAEAVVTPMGEDEVKVWFEEPQMAITPGQAIVFYDWDVVVGGGTVERTS